MEGEKEGGDGRERGVRSVYACGGRRREGVKKGGREMCVYVCVCVCSVCVRV